MTPCLFSSIYIKACLLVYDNLSAPFCAASFSVGSQLYNTRFLSCIIFLTVSIRAPTSCFFQEKFKKTHFSSFFRITLA